MVNELAQYNIFSTFDLRSAYHQIKIIDSEQKFTAFEANGKLYEFTRIPFGVKNGVAAFQRKITQFIEEERLSLITDQRSVAFMLDSRRRTKIRNSKVQQWRIELPSFSYTIKYRPGKQNTGPDTFSKAFCSSITSRSSLEELHNNLCHPGISRLLHFVRAKNLPFSTTDVKRVVNSCPICAEIKPQLHRGVNNTLIKATHPMERLSIDFKSPLPSSSNN